MAKIYSMLFAILAGASTSLEAFFNGELGHNTSPLIATFISLVVGAVFFLVAMIFSGDIGECLKLTSISPHLLLGGVFGGCIIYFTVKAIPGLGVSNTLTLIVVSQILLGFFIDAVILKNTTMHLYKYIGCALLVMGTFFIVN